MAEAPPDSSLSKQEIALGVVKAAAAVIPVVGGPIVEFINLAVKRTLETRLNTFLADVASRLEALEADGRCRLSDLAQNELFADVVLQASLAAGKSRHRTKHEALRNAVLNSILPSAPEADLQELFIGFIDAFSPWHLAILSHLARDPGVQDGGGYAASRVNTPLGTLLEEAFPDLQGKQPVYQHFLTDLQARGLLAAVPRAGALVDAPWAVLQIAPMGKAFLSFISAPPTSEGGAS